MVHEGAKAAKAVKEYSIGEGDLYGFWNAYTD